MCSYSVESQIFVQRLHSIFWYEATEQLFFFVIYLQKIFAQLNYVRISESAQSVTE